MLVHEDNIVTNFEPETQMVRIEFITLLLFTENRDLKRRVKINQREPKFSCPEELLPDHVQLVGQRSRLQRTLILLGKPQRQLPPGKGSSINDVTLFKEKHDVNFLT